MLVAITEFLDKVRPPVEYRLYGCDAHPDHIVIRLPRRDQLHPEPRSRDQPDQGIGGTPGQLDDLKRDAGDHGDQEDPEDDARNVTVRPDEKEQDDAYQHDEHRKAAPAALVQACALPCVLDAEFKSVLNAVDALVLSAMVLVQPADILHRADAGDIQ